MSLEVLDDVSVECAYVYSIQELFKSGEHGVLCFAVIYDVALGACDGVEDVLVLHGEV